MGAGTPTTVLSHGLLPTADVIAVLSHGLLTSEAAEATGRRFTTTGRGSGAFAVAGRGTGAFTATGDNGTGGN